MKGKILFVAGAAVGYVFGARAGRKRYEQIRSAAQAVWETDGVQNQVHQVQAFAAQRVGEVPGALLNGAKKAFMTVSGLKKDAQRSATAQSPEAEETGTRGADQQASAASKPAAEKPAVKKPAVKKPAASKPAASKPAPKQSTSRKTPPADAEM